MGGCTNTGNWRKGELYDKGDLVRLPNQVLQRVIDARPYGDTLYMVEADLTSFDEFAEDGDERDPTLDHIATALKRIQIPFWRWKLDIIISKVLHPCPDGKGYFAHHGHECAIHFWRKPRTIR